LIGGEEAQPVYKLKKIRAELASLKAIRKLLSSIGPLKRFQNTNPNKWRPCTQ
jgi:hypothetical protein